MSRVFDALVPPRWALISTRVAAVTFDVRIANDADLVPAGTFALRVTLAAADPLVSLTVVPRGSPGP
ncbi:hypothetical protein [Actinocorallia sp. B10E7]|uniref:hypothetical protein n=1 Tax=Actinocorallia sp. B10E7 TaxID=3153558 RepID=UPI00325FCC37